MSNYLYEESRAAEDATVVDPYAAYDEPDDDNYDPEDEDYDNSPVIDTTVNDPEGGVSDEEFWGRPR